jgi:flavin reductase (DIM6/NTAB) family NADH-FMN oxidoreductase RutF
MYSSFSPQDLHVSQVHKYLLGSVAPRPICFASTVDKNGNRNLAPFSFFNVFSANPPIAVFSPARSGRTGETKNTLDNVLEVPEVVINVVTYNMVHQTSLASSPYSKGVDEFIKSGFTPLKSDLIKPFRVAESPVQFECKVIEVKSLGKEGAAGNLVICEILKIHIDNAVLDKDKQIDQTKIDLVARMGGNWYCRAFGDAIFEVKKPLTTCGMGVDTLPDHIRLSKRLTGNHLGMLGNIEKIPEQKDIESARKDYERIEDKVGAAIALLNKGEVYQALCLLYSEGE